HFIFFVSPKPLYNTIFFQILSWILPLILFNTAMDIGKIKKLWFFIGVFLMGIFVSLGANPPFGREFIYIFKHVSFLQAFRNPYEKYGIVYAFGYAPLFAYGLVNLAELLVIPFKKKLKIDKKFFNLQWVIIIFVLIFTSG